MTKPEGVYERRITTRSEVTAVLKTCAIGQPCIDTRLAEFRTRKKRNLWDLRSCLELADRNVGTFLIYELREDELNVGR